MEGCTFWLYNIFRNVCFDLIVCHYDWTFDFVNKNYWETNCLEISYCVLYQLSYEIHNKHFSIKYQHIFACVCVDYSSFLISTRKKVTFWLPKQSLLTQNKAICHALGSSSGFSPFTIEISYPKCHAKCYMWQGFPLHPSDLDVILYTTGRLSFKEHINE